MSDLGAHAEKLGVELWHEPLNRYEDHMVNTLAQGAELCRASGSRAVKLMVVPSGCGKSTLLRMIAGLEETKDGTIRIPGEDVTDTEPAERGIAIVFLSCALYPHMTVAQNMTFGLRVTGVPKAEIERRLSEAAQIRQLDTYLDRRPAQLSGGQRQRVAIGRAILRDPKVFLFDEPLSNLDAELRVHMRQELARLHRRLGAAMKILPNLVEQLGDVGYLHGVTPDGAALVTEVTERQPATPTHEMRLAIDPARAFLFDSAEQRLRLAQNA